MKQDLDTQNEEPTNTLKTPESCYVPLDVELEVGIVKWGETGYYRTDWGQVADNIDNLHEFVNMKNEQLGVTKAQWNAMHFCSMFGNWGNYFFTVVNYQKREDILNV